MDRKSFLGSVIGLFAAGEIAAQLKPEEPAFVYEPPKELPFNEPVEPYSVIFACDDKDKIVEKGRQFYVADVKEDGLYGNYFGDQGVEEYTRLKEKYYLRVCSVTNEK